MINQKASGGADDGTLIFLNRAFVQRPAFQTRWAHVNQFVFKRCHGWICTDLLKLINGYRCTSLDPKTIFPGLNNFSVFLRAPQVPFVSPKSGAGAGVGVGMVRGGLKGTIIAT